LKYSFITTYYDEDQCLINYRTDEKLLQFWSEKSPKKRDHLEELGVDGRMPLKWMLKANDWRVFTGLIWLRTVTIAGLLRGQ